MWSSTIASRSYSRWAQNQSLVIANLKVISFAGIKVMEKGEIRITK